VFPISAIIRLTLLLEQINALERLRKRLAGRRRHIGRGRKVRERVVTGVVAAKCGSNHNGIFTAHSKLRSDEKGKDREQEREGERERMEVNKEAR